MRSHDMYVLHWLHPLPQAPPTDKRRKAREELSKLREATVQYRNVSTSLDL